MQYYKLIFNGSKLSSYPSYPMLFVTTWGKKQFWPLLYPFMAIVGGGEYMGIKWVNSVKT